MLFIFLILVAIVLAQPSPPALGIQIGNLTIGSDIRFPLNVTQCEPVFIYYNVTITVDYYVVLLDAGHSYHVLTIGPIPIGVGYFEWVCNIPAGYGFWVVQDNRYFTVVQPGPLSSCLHNVTTTYQYASYITTSFAFYTARTPITTAVSLIPEALAT
jgi:hypothetical protein